MSKFYTTIIFIFLSLVSYCQFSIGLTGDSKTPFGFEVGFNKVNLILMTSSKKSEGYTPIAYGNNTVNRRTVNSVVGMSGGIKIYKELYSDLGLLLSNTSDKVNVSNVTKGSYSYDPDDGYDSKSEVGMIFGFSYYLDKFKISTGVNLFSSGSNLKYGISYRL